MKFWRISAVVCVLVAGCATTQPTSSPAVGYTVSTNQTELTILWQGQAITHGVASNVTVSVSPDGQSVAWVENHLAGHITVDGAGDPVYAGTLYMAHAGGQLVLIPKLKSARGYDFPEEDPDSGVVYHPQNLKWDSRSQYLYFTTQPWVTRCMLWQLKPGSTIPRGIVPLSDYRLLKKLHGPDWVEAYETNYEHQDFVSGIRVRDETTTYIYTPEEMASEKYVSPARRSSLGKDWQPK